MSHNLHSLKGAYIGDYIEEYYRLLGVTKGDGSHDAECVSFVFCYGSHDGECFLCLLPRLREANGRETWISDALIQLPGRSSS